MELESGPQSKCFKEELNSLQEKLHHASSIYLDREKQYDFAYKDMELKLRRAIASRDQILELRESEANNQQCLIEQLQKTCERLENEKSKSLEQAQQQNEDTRNKLLLELKESQSKHLKSLIDKFKRNCEMVQEFNVDSSDMIVNIEKLFSYISDQYIDVIETKRSFQRSNEIKSSNELSTQAEEYQSQIKELKIINNKKEIQNQHLRNDFEIEINEYKDLIKTFEEKLSKSSDEMKRLKDTSNLTIEKFEKEVEVIKANQQTLLQEKKSLEKLIETSEIEKTRLQRTINIKDENVCKLEEQLMHLRKEKNQFLEENEKQNEHQKLSKIKFENELILVDEKLRKMFYTDLLQNERLKSLLKQNQELCEEKEELKQKVIEANFVVESLQKNEKLYLNEVSKKDEDINRLNLDKQSLDNQIRSYEFELNKLKSTHAEDMRIEMLKNNKEKQIIIDKCNSYTSKLQASEILQKTLNEKINSLSEDIDMKKDKLNELEKTIVEKDAIIKNFDYKISTLEKDCNHQCNINIEKDKIINELKKEKRAIVKKLKEKHEKLMESERMLQSMEYELTNHQMENKALANEYKKLSEEKDCMEMELQNYNQVREKEISKIIEKLHGSKEDVAFLKKILKNHKEMDTQAIQAATQSQQEMTKQRAQIDSLKSKLKWLKDALQVSEKARFEVTNCKTVDRNELFEKMQKHMMSLESMNKNLQIQLDNCHEEVNALHTVLQQVAMKYDVIYSKVLKQENIFRDEANTEARYFQNKRNGDDEMVHMIRQFKNMKEMLSSTLENLNNKPSFQSAVSPVRRKSNENITKATPYLNSNNQQPKLSSEQTANSKSTDESVFSNSQKLEDYIKKHDASSQIYSSRTNNEDVNIPSALSDIESSVSPSSQKVVESWLQHDGENQNKLQTDNNHRTKNLQETLDRLLKMGKNLEQNNEEMADLIGDDAFNELL